MPNWWSLSDCLCLQDAHFQIAAEATAAIEGLSGKGIRSCKVLVQLARKPEPAEAMQGTASDGEGASGNEGRKRSGDRGV